MSFPTLASPDKVRKAEELIAKQLVDGERVLQAEPRPSRIRVSQRAFRDAETFFLANQLGRGVRPGSVDPESVKELMASGVLRREGHARGTTYTLLKRPTELQPDSRIKFKSVAQSRPQRVGTAPSENAILTIGQSEKTYIRNNVREYLAFATSTEARKHEERRQSENILDVMHVRAKEILRASRQSGGPRITPLEAARQAQVEVALDFQQLLKLKWMPIMFDLFGMEETPDTNMQTMRER